MQDDVYEVQELNHLGHMRKVSEVHFVPRCSQLRTDLPLPNANYLGLHWACCMIGGRSGATDYLHAQIEGVPDFQDVDLDKVVKCKGEFMVIIDSDGRRTLVQATGGFAVATIVAVLDSSVTAPSLYVSPRTSYNSGGPAPSETPAFM